jgi:hypothetical protein
MSIASTLWRQLEAIGHARAQHELHRLASRWELTHPALAQQMRQASLRRPEDGAGSLPPGAAAQPTSGLALLQRR